MSMPGLGITPMLSSASLSAELEKQPYVPYMICTDMNASVQSVQAVRDRVRDGVVVDAAAVPHWTGERES
eukprot:7654767-Alexandrium_andersonii.AAC.1